MGFDGLSKGCRELSISHLQCGMLFLIYVVKCNAIEIENALFYQFLKPETNKVMVLYSKPQKWFSIALQKYKIKIFLKKGI